MAVGRQRLIGIALEAQLQPLRIRARKTKRAGRPFEHAGDTGGWGEIAFFGRAVVVDFHFYTPATMAVE